MARQKNILYGENYKVCPCAQIVYRDTAYTSALIQPTCHSPKRGFPHKINTKDIDQVRLCSGGTSHGKRYTSCPYYVKNPNINVEGVVRKSTVGGFLTDLLMPGLFIVIAFLLFKQHDSTSFWAGVFFLAIGILLLLSQKAKPAFFKGRRKKK